MASECMPMPGSFNDFREDLENHGQVYETEDHYVNYYEFALQGVAREVAERKNLSLLEVHNPEFIIAA